MNLVAYDSSDDSSDDDKEVIMSESLKSSLNKRPNSPKKTKEPVKICIPSLLDFKDVDEEIEAKKNKLQPSQRGTGLFALLPPPKGARTLANFVPHVLKKPSTCNKNIVKPTTTITSTNNTTQLPSKQKVNSINKMTHALNLLKYDSNSDNDDDDDDDDDDDNNKTSDFFSLDKPINLPITPQIEAANLYKEPDDKSTASINIELINDNKNESTLTSNVINLSRDDIIMKNKADVGPKLPIPEQEYHVDAEGNVAFDEKAIEYLCGKRGVKRKSELINSTNIIDINGEDIKPDEREWLVKALTENPVQRPVTIGSGPGGQSKKKHQITYLAHQAKAMEVELQNQWASNRVAKNQAKSKYGF